MDERRGRQVAAGRGITVIGRWDCCVNPIAGDLLTTPLLVPLNCALLDFVHLVGSYGALKNRFVKWRAGSNGVAEATQTPNCLRRPRVGL